MAMNASSSVAASVSPPSQPWSQIVASAAPHSSPSPPPSAIVVVDTPSVTPAAEDIDNNSGENNANIGQRIVWNKPSNAASSSVMDAESWPALSESAKAPAKSPPPPPLEVGETSLGASTLPQLQVFFLSKFSIILYVKNYVYIAYFFSYSVLVCLIFSNYLIYPVRVCCICCVSEFVMFRYFSYIICMLVKNIWSCYWKSSLSAFILLLYMFCFCFCLYRVLVLLKFWNC